MESLSMKSRTLILALLVALAATSTSWSFFKKSHAGVDMTAAAEQFVGSLDAQQRKIAVLPYGVPQRLQWHFIPLDSRKGLQLKEMTDVQRTVAHKLLMTSLSKLGYRKAKQIMQLEKLLNHLEMGKGRNIRDPQRYYFTIFGEPKAENRWGLSIEGHHLSLNFVVEGGKIIASTPQFMAANPAEVKEDYLPEIKKGTRVLAKEETLAFDLLNSLTEEQARAAIIADKAPREIRGAGEAQPPADAAVGVRVDQLNERQQKVFRSLLSEYLRAMPPEVAAQRLLKIEAAGFGEIRFAWAGARQPGIGHYYRVQGPTFLIEFVNTQPDSAGNPANHIHCVWRNMHGDFALSVTK
jgi:hypothetical protein